MSWSRTGCRGAGGGDVDAGETLAIVLLTVAVGRVHVLEPISGRVVADHALVAPSEVSVADAHYGWTRPDKPQAGDHAAAHRG